MPRTRQGGPRGGTPGRSYPNRTDIGAQPNLPARAATGQTYGQAQSQLQAQATVPMAPPRLALPPAASPATAGGGPGLAGTPGSPPALPPAGPYAQPGAAGDLHRATERPFEPVTAGAALGAGPGPESLAGPAQALGTINSVSSVLARAANATNSPVLQQMAARAQAAGQ